MSKPDRPEEPRVTVYFIRKNTEGTCDYVTLDISASQAGKGTVRHQGDHLAICLAKMHADVRKDMGR